MAEARIRERDMAEAGIRPEMLKRYYEASYGQQEVGENAFRGATFEEYYQLQRILFPGISRRGAGELSERAEFRKLAAKLPPDPPWQPKILPGFHMLGRKAELDLASAKLGRDVRNLALDRIKSITRWVGLRQPERLEGLSLTVCGAAPGEPLRPPLAVERVDLMGCSKSCVELVLWSTQARRVRILYEEPSALDVKLLEGHVQLEELWVDSDMTRGLKTLEQLSLKVLHLSGVVPGRDLKRVLAARAKMLEEAGLVSHEPFGPSLLPEFPALRILEVPAYDEFRKEWVGWAVAHPQVACRFPPLPEQPKRPVVQLAEIHCGVDILRIRKGKQVTFEVASNLVEEVLDTEEMDNGELEDKMRVLATKEGRQARWSSESDTFVMQAKDIETCRWLIDSVHELREQMQRKGRR